MSNKYEYLEGDVGYPLFGPVTALNCEAVLIKCFAGVFGTIPDATALKAVEKLWNQIFVAMTAWLYYVGCRREICFDACKRRGLMLLDLCLELTEHIMAPVGGEPNPRLNSLIRTINQDSARAGVRYLSRMVFTRMMDLLSTERGRQDALFFVVDQKNRDKEGDESVLDCGAGADADAMRGFEEAEEIMATTPLANLGGLVPDGTDTDALRDFEEAECDSAASRLASLGENFLVDMCFLTKAVGINRQRVAMEIIMGRHVPLTQEVVRRLEAKSGVECGEMLAPLMRRAVAYKLPAKLGTTVDTFIRYLYRRTDGKAYDQFYQRIHG